MKTDREKYLEVVTSILLEPLFLISQAVVIYTLDHILPDVWIFWYRTDDYNQKWSTDDETVSAQTYFMTNSMWSPDVLVEHSIWKSMGINVDKNNLHSSEKAFSEILEPQEYN